jgi:hypothetical protein
MQIAFRCGPLFGASRGRKSTTNDADRLRKCLNAGESRLRSGFVKATAREVNRSFSLQVPFLANIGSNCLTNPALQATGIRSYMVCRCGHLDDNGVKSTRGLPLWSKNQATRE